LRIHPASEKIVAAGFVTSVTEWYINGAVKSRITNEPVERNGKRVEERFRDNGFIEQRRTLSGHDPSRLEAFDEAGKLKEESLYAREGHVRLYRKFAADGRVVHEEERYPDGSRKVLKRG